jgi:hypothetical protein
MKTTFLSIYEIGNFIGSWGCVLYVVIMAVAMVWVMRRYVK